MTGSTEPHRFAVKDEILEPQLDRVDKLHRCEIHFIGHGTSAGALTALVAPADVNPIRRFYGIAEIKCFPFYVD